MAHVGQELTLGGVRRLGQNRHFVGAGRGLFKLAVRLDQRLLRPLAVGDIGVGAEHHQRLAVGGPGDDATAIVNPDPVAILVLHPAFAVVVGQFAREVPLQQFGGLLHVIGVGKHLPDLDVNGDQLMERIADELRPYLVEDRFPCLDVPFPGADMGTFDDALQPPVRIAQRLVHSLALGDVIDGDDGMFTAIEKDRLHANTQPGTMFLAVNQ